MPTRRIGDLREEVPWACHDPEHEIPSMFSGPPGIYEHECPKCGRKVTFKIEATRLVGGAPSSGLISINGGLRTSRHSLFYK